MSRRKRRSYKEGFKLQMVTLYMHGKLRTEIIREYEQTHQHLINGSKTIIIEALLNIVTT